MAEETMVRHRHNNRVNEDYKGELGTGAGATALHPASAFRCTWRWQQPLENLVWLAASLFIIFYGDARTNFFTVIFADSRIRRTPFNSALVCLTINAGIFVYVAVWRRQLLNHSADNWDVVAPVAIRTATFLGLLATLLFAVALWPVWSILTLPLLFTLFMAFVIISPYLPPYVSAAGTKCGGSHVTLGHRP